MPSAAQKLIVVVGATGSQGGSVVDSFLADPAWRVRALTRNPQGSKAQALAAKSPNIEVAAADMGDVSSLAQAFEGAHAIFGMTDFWTLYGDSSNREYAEKKGQPFPQWCQDAEILQGKNIFEAASQIPSLDRLVFSGLSNATKWSGGKYKHVLHFDSKALAAEWAQETLPELWKKTSVVQVGFYLENFRSHPFMMPKKDGDSFVFKLSESPDGAWPMVAAEKDTGALTYALVNQLPAGRNVIGYRQLMSISEFIDLWSKTLGVKARFEIGNLSAPPELEQELREAFAYGKEFGYWGFKDESVVHPKDLGVKVDMGSVEGWIRDQDWSALLHQ